MTQYILQYYTMPDPVSLTCSVRKQLQSLGIRSSGLHFDATMGYTFINFDIFYFRWHRDPIKFHTIQINTMLPRLLYAKPMS